MTPLPSEDWHDEVVTGVVAEYSAREVGDMETAAGGHPKDLYHVAP